MVFKSLEKKPSLQQGQNDSQAFESVMNADKVEHLSDPTNKSKVISAFNYFIDNIEEDKFDITNIYTFSDFVLIELEENEDEQQIFDTINSLGVDLTTSELLKNYFFVETLFRSINRSGQAFLKKTMRLSLTGAKNMNLGAQNVL